MREDTDRLPTTADDPLCDREVIELIGDLWLVAADAEPLADRTSSGPGLPVFWFDELEQLRGKTLAELKAIGMVKVFPGSRVLQ